MGKLGFRIKKVAQYGIANEQWIQHPSLGTLT